MDMAVIALQRPACYSLSCGLTVTVYEQGAAATAAAAYGVCSPVSWPNVTFQLPASLSEGGTVYRAQLKVVPKGNACEVGCTTVLFRLVVIQ